MEINNCKNCNSIPLLYQPRITDFNFHVIQCMTKECESKLIIQSSDKNKVIEIWNRENPTT